MQPIRKHLSYANVVATLALLFAMTGGAIAANHYLITSAKQINPKVLRRLTGRTGPAGAPGARGAEGKQGVEGKQGNTGNEGPRGLPGTASVARAFVQKTFLTAVPLETLDTTVLSTHSSGNGVDLSLSEGATVFVQATVQAANTGAGVAKVECQLAEEGEEIEEAVAYGPVTSVEIAAGAIFQSLSLTGVVELSGDETYDMRVECKTGQAGQKASIGAGALTAVAYE